MNSKTPSYLYTTKDSRPTVVYPKNGSDFSLEELRHFVGGPIELVTLGDCYMVVNEEGKLRGLPFNPSASRLYSLFYDDIDCIVGDALLCKIELIP